MHGHSDAIRRVRGFGATTGVKTNLLALLDNGSIFLHLFIYFFSLAFFCDIDPDISKLLKINWLEDLNQPTCCSSPLFLIQLAASFGAARAELQLGKTMLLSPPPLNY